MNDTLVQNFDQNSDIGCKVSYSIGMDPDIEDQIMIRIDSGEYQNVVFSIDKISFREDETDGNPVVSIDWNVLDYPSDKFDESIANDKILAKEIFTIAIDMLSSEDVPVEPKTIH